MTSSAGCKRVDQRWVAAQSLHGIAHGCEIHHRGNAREILQQHPAGHESDLLDRSAFCRPRTQRPDVVRLHCLAVLAAQQVLQQYAQRVGQVLDEASVLFNGGEFVDLEFAVAGAEDSTAAETVHG